MPDNFKNRLVQAMQHRGIKAAELAKRTGLSKAQISQYTNGVYEAKQTALYKLAVALDVSEAWLMGHDVDMERLISQKCAEQTNMIEMMQLHYGSEVTDLVQLFSSLNRKGKKKALDQLQDLNKITEYIEKEGNE